MKIIDEYGYKAIKLDSLKENEIKEIEDWYSKFRSSKIKIKCKEIDESTKEVLVFDI